MDLATWRLLAVLGAQGAFLQQFLEELVAGVAAWISSAEGLELDSLLCRAPVIWER